MESLIRQPKHYLGCSELGKDLLLDADFSHFIEHQRHLFNVECIEVIYSLNFDFALGNTLKYLWRVGEKEKGNRYKKNKAVILDLSKALYYLKYFINKEKAEGKEVWHWVTRLNRVLSNHLEELQRIDKSSFFSAFLYDYSEVN